MARAPVTPSQGRGHRGTEGHRAKGGQWESGGRVCGWRPHASVVSGSEQGVAVGHRATCQLGQTAPACDRRPSWRAGSGLAPVASASGQQRGHRPPRLSLSSAPALATAQRLLETEHRRNNCHVKPQASDSRQKSRPERLLSDAASHSLAVTGGARTQRWQSGACGGAAGPRRCDPAGERRLRPACPVGTLRPGSRPCGPHQCGDQLRSVWGGSAVTSLCGRLWGACW